MLRMSDAAGNDFGYMFLRSTVNIAEWSRVRELLRILLSGGLVK